MKTNKYKILVLSDLKESTSSTLTSSVSLANMINGEIHFFYVKKPTEIVSRDNQLSAIRTINEQQSIIENKILTILKPISAAYNLNFKHKFSIGNVKNEIANYIKELQPDIIVLGKRKPRVVKFIGDGITNFVLKNYDGVVMIADNKNALEPNKEIALGVLNDMIEKLDISFAEDLMNHSQKPLKSFKINKNSNDSSYSTNSEQNNIVEFVFEQGDNVINSISKYLSKSQIDLLFLDRMDNRKDTNRTSMNSDIQRVMDSLNVSLLLANGKAITKQ